MNSEDDFKKLVVHTILLSGSLEGKGQRPMPHKEEKEAYQLFSTPDYNDSSNFILSKLKFEEGKLFSVNALEKFLYMIRLFIGGRIIGNYEKTKREPEVVKVTVTVEHMSHEQYKKEVQNEN